MKPEQVANTGVIPALDDSKDFPLMQKAKKEMPFDDPIGRIPKAANKRNGSMERGRRNGNGSTKKEAGNEVAPMEEDVVEIDSPEVAKDNKKKKPKKKKRKLGALSVDVTDEDQPLSNEANHFRIFARKHFTIILRRMGMIKHFLSQSQNPYLRNLFLLIITHSFSVRNFSAEKLGVVKAIVSESEILKLIIQDCDSSGRQIESD